LEVLSSALGWWDKERRFTRKPEVTYPDKVESSREALTRTEAAALLKAAMGWRKDPVTGSWSRLGGSAKANRAHLRRMVLIGVYTGSRPGVQQKLLWRESPTQAWVDLRKAIIYRRGKLEREHRTKKRPLCKLPTRLLAHMERWRRLDDRAEAAARDAGRSLTLNSVLHHGGRPLAGKVRTGFAGIVRDAGLSEKVTPHWLRHTAATWLMENDCESWEAAGYLGMTVATLERVYGHHRPSHQSAARRAHSRR
jgi:integrase